MALTLQGAKSLAYANYERGGDYVLEMLTDDEIRNRFCTEGGKKAMYDFMGSVAEMRDYIERTCMA